MTCQWEDEGKDKNVLDTLCRGNTSLKTGTEAF